LHIVSWNAFTGVEEKAKDQTAIHLDMQLCMLFAQTELQLVSVAHIPVIVTAGYCPSHDTDAMVLLLLLLMVSVHHWHIFLLFVRNRKMPIPTTVHIFRDYCFPYRGRGSTAAGAPVDRLSIAYRTYQPFNIPVDIFI